MKPGVPDVIKRVWLLVVVMVVVGVQLACNFPGRGPSTQVSPRLLELTATLASLLATPEPATLTPAPPAASVTPQPSQTPAARRYILRDGITRETFSTANAATAVPGDVLSMVPAPGGVGYEGPFCAKEYTVPTIEMAPKTVAVFSLFEAVNTCGWKDGEKVVLTITAPDGQQTTQENVFDGQIGWGVVYPLSPRLGDLLGKYTVRFEGSSGVLEHVVEVVPPSTPGMEKTADHQFFLHNFPAGAYMRLFAYRLNSGGDTFNLAGWREVQVDSAGELLIDEQYQDDKIALVLLDGAGKQYMATWGPGLDILKSAQAASCPGAPATRLQPGGMASVSSQQQTANNLRTSPSPQAPVLGLLPPGEKLTILNTNPVCAGGYLWWNVRAERINLTGWTAEGSGDNYWLVP